MKIRFVLLLIIVLFTFIGACYFLPALVPQPHKGIILISLDTLRADQLGTYVVTVSDAGRDILCVGSRLCTERG